MSDLPQLQQTLFQMLENLQRCGLQRIPRGSASALGPNLQVLVAQLRAPVILRAPVMQTQSGAPIPARATAPPTRFETAPNAGSTAPRVEPQRSVPAPVAKPAAGNTEGSVANWELPVLSLGERQTHFDALNSQIKSCRLCTDIVCYRQQTVFGTGPLKPVVCFMGEAPGADEDRQGVPFVGRAGQLLTKIIDAMQLKREEVFILNALKCRPPQNRTPVPEEIENCHPFVAQQLSILQPQFIVCLGAVAVRSLLGSTLSVGSLRGRFHHYRQAKVVVTYHPSYLLRNESAKKLVWQDMQMLMQELGLKPPPKSK